MSKIVVMARAYNTRGALVHEEALQEYDDNEAVYVLEDWEDDSNASPLTRAYGYVQDLLSNYEANRGILWKLQEQHGEHWTLSIVEKYREDKDPQWSITGLQAFYKYHA